MENITEMEKDLANVKASAEDVTNQVHQKYEGSFKALRDYQKVLIDKLIAWNATIPAIQCHACNGLGHIGGGVPCYDCGGTGIEGCKLALCY